MKQPAGPPMTLGNRAMIRSTPRRMKSRVEKRPVSVNGHCTGVSLEDDFWNALKEIATTHNVSVSQLISKIDSQQQDHDLSSAIRVYVLSYYRERCNAKAPGPPVTLGNMLGRGPC